jgi:hypothetical protein
MSQNSVNSSVLSGVLQDGVESKYNSCVADCQYLEFIFGRDIGLLATAAAAAITAASHIICDSTIHWYLSCYGSASNSINSPCAQIETEPLIQINEAFIDECNVRPMNGMFRKLVWFVVINYDKRSI